VAELLDVISQATDTYERSFADERMRLAHTVRGKAILVIDSSFGVPTVNLQSRLKYLREIDGQPDAANLVLQKCLGGVVPRNTTEVLSKFLGPDVNLVHQDIRYQRRYFKGEVAGIILTGSPANVDYDGSDQKLSKHTSLGHREVFERLKNIHNFCLAEGIPVLAFCFGFHIITKLLGGDVKEMEESRSGFETVTVTEKGNKVLKNLFGRRLGGGDVYVSHSQQALLNPRASLELMDIEDEDSGKRISHGSISANPDDANFNDNPLRNASRVRQLMEDGRYVSLALQSHPELAFVNAILRNLIANKAVSEYEKLPGRMRFVGELLALMTDFFAAHKRTGK
jgi:hypothetical protein